jgi:hypothetical protein
LIVWRAALYRELGWLFRTDRAPSGVLALPQRCVILGKQNPRNQKKLSARPQAESAGTNAVSDTSKRVKRKRNPKSKLKSAAKLTRKRPPASIRLSLRPLEIALLDLRLQYLNEQAVKFQFKCPKSRADVIRSLLQSVIETRGLGFPKEGRWHDRVVATVQKYGIPADWSPVAAKRARET